MNIFNLGIVKLGINISAFLNLSCIKNLLETATDRSYVAGHLAGPRCRCVECQKLKKIEDKWICRLGSFYGDSGLNTCDEIKARSRVNYIG